MRNRIATVGVVAVSTLSFFGLWAKQTNSPAALKSVSLNPAAVTAGQGSTGFVTLTADAPSKGIVVNLSSNNTVASEPSSVTVPAGVSSVTFKVTTSGVSTSTLVTIKATYNGVTKSAGLTVSPDSSTIAPLSITTSSLPGGTTSVAYSTTLTASGGVAPYTWSVSVGSLPAGLQLNASTGVISGTPTATGTTNFTVQVTDNNSNTATKALSVVVQAPLSISTITLPSGQVSSAYSTAVTATGGTPPYTWSISSGAVPTGLSLATGTGVISGTPSASGTFNIALTVRDAQAASTTANFSITIAASLQITTTSLPSGVVGSPYDATLAATGGTPPYTWGISSGSLPSSLALAATTGTIGGTPSTAGTFTPTLQVTDSANNTANQPYSFAIADPADSVLLTWTASQTATVTGYNIYRASGGSFSKINSAPVQALAYTDSTVVSGQTYDYAVTAVDATGDESAYSQEVQTNIP